MPEQPISSPNPDTTTAGQPDINLDPTPVDTPGTANQGQNEPQPQVIPSGEGETPQPPVDESFTEIDPNTLSAENQKAYKNMLTDYKRKTQAVADQRRSIEANQREAEELRQKASVYDQISSDEAFIDYWNSLPAQGGATPTGQPTAQQAQALGLSDEDFNEALSSKEGFSKVLERTIKGHSEREKIRQDQLEADLRVQKANQFVRDFKSKPDYTDFDKYDKHKFITYQVALHRPHPKSSEKDWDKLLNGAYSNAKNVYNDIYNEGYQAGIQRLKQKEGNLSETPTRGTGPVYQGGKPKEISTSEAFDLAKRGIRVPQDW